MKCTNCGKNNASFHYEYNINGQRTEMHLCPECAARLQPEREFANRTQSLFGDFFNDGFLGGSLLNDSIFGNGFFGDSMFGNSMFLEPMVSFFPAMLMPVRVRRAAVPNAPQTGAETNAGAATNVGADPELSRQREVNALREQMKAAAEAEDYERAAKLRDELKKLEKSE